jgi:hypothetical protein
MVEGTLLEKLRKIEALHAGTTVDGEREAARRAAERIRARLAELRGREQDVVLVYSLPDPWKRQLFVALCRRYGLAPSPFKVCSCVIRAAGEPLTRESCPHGASSV